MPLDPPGVAEAPPGAYGRRRVLVVEDNTDAARTLTLLLQLAGHEVQVAGDGQAALEASRAFRPDVVLLDLGLPGMDGYTVARKLRQDSGLRDTPIVAITGYGHEEHIRRAYEAGFDHHMIKPVGAQTLHALIARLTAGGGPDQRPR